MKIALVRARYNPYGGAERFAARALGALAADRDQTIEVAVLARRWQDGEALSTPVRLVRCDPFYVGSVWRDASFATAVHRHLRDERFDLVQSHERIVGLPIYRAGDGVHAAWLDRRARAAGASTRVAIAFNPHHRYLTRVERAMFEDPSLHVVICNSEMVRREIVDRFAIAAHKLVLIRNGSRWIGSGFERKGVGPALRALRDCPDAALVVVGDDKHRARYEADATRLGVAGRVRFVGSVMDPLPYYAMADILLAPTLYDPFPNAVLEALACGLPVIATDACGAAEILEEDISGWVVPAGEHEALTVAMQIAGDCHANRRAVMRSAARQAAAPHSLAALSMALIALYRAVLARR